MGTRGARSPPPPGRPAAPRTPRTRPRPAAAPVRWDLRVSALPTHPLGAPKSGEEGTAHAPPHARRPRPRLTRNVRQPQPPIPPRCHSDPSRTAAERARPVQRPSPTGGKREAGRRVPGSFHPPHAQAPGSQERSRPPDPRSGSAARGGVGGVGRAGPEGPRLPRWAQGRRDRSYPRPPKAGAETVLEKGRGPGCPGGRGLGDARPPAPRPASRLGGLGQGSCVGRTFLRRSGCSPAGGAAPGEPWGLGLPFCFRCCCSLCCFVFSLLKLFFFKLSAREGAHASAGEPGRGGVGGAGEGRESQAGYGWRSAKWGSNSPTVKSCPELGSEVGRLTA